MDGAEPRLTISPSSPCLLGISFYDRNSAGPLPRRAAKVAQTDKLSLHGEPNGPIVGMLNEGSVVSMSSMITVRRHRWAKIVPYRDDQARCFAITCSVKLSETINFSVAVMLDLMVPVGAIGRLVGGDSMKPVDEVRKHLRIFWGAAR